MKMVLVINTNDYNILSKVGGELNRYFLLTYLGFDESNPNIQYSKQFHELFRKALAEYRRTTGIDDIANTDIDKQIFSSISERILEENKELNMIEYVGLQFFISRIKAGCIWTIVLPEDVYTDIPSYLESFLISIFLTYIRTDFKRSKTLEQVALSDTNFTLTFLFMNQKKDYNDMRVVEGLLGDFKFLAKDDGVVKSGADRLFHMLEYVTDLVDEYGGLFDIG